MAAQAHSFRGFETQNSLAPGILIGHTNAVLDDDQALRVREHLADAQNELQQWYRDFAVLLATRPRIEDRIYRCKVALAPHKKLPVEITREIMLLAVGVPPDFPLAREVVLDPRLQITQVCADWRRIAFAIPELWKITLSHIPNRSSASKLINAWWSQCSEFGLSLMMDETDILKPEPYRHFDTISSDHFLFEHLILPYSTRLLKLNILMQVETARKMLALPPGSFKALETLMLTVEQPLDQSDPLLHSDDLNTAFTFSPYLSRVFFQAVPFTDPLLLRLPWRQLTQLVLSIHNFPADLLLLLLSYCPLLSTCFIDLISDVNTDTVTRIASMPRLRLANLIQLRLHFAGSHNHRQFLHAFSLPKLSALKFTYHLLQDWTPLHYAAFLRSVKSTLLHFYLTEPINIRRDFARIPSDHNFDERLMSYMPQIETFKVPNGFTISPFVLEKIARGELLPSVTKMEFNMNSLRPALEMLDERLSRSRAHNADGQTAISAIKTAVVSCGSSSGMDDMIQGLRDQGINIMIKVLP